MSSLILTPGSIAGSQSRQANSAKVETFDDLANRSFLVESGESARGSGRRAKVAGGAVLSGAALAAGDVLTYLMSWYVLSGFIDFDGVTLRFCALAGVTAMASYAASSLYPGYRIHPPELIRRRSTATLKLILIALGGAVFVGTWQIPVTIAGYLILALAFQLATRSLIATILYRAGIWGDYSVVLGSAAQVTAVQKYFFKNWRLGVRFDAVRGRNKDCLPRIALLAGPLPTPEELSGLRHHFPEIVALADLPCGQSHGLRPADLNGAIGLTLACHRTAHYPLILNRILDIVVASIALVLTAPILIMAAAAIYMTDPGPVIYRQTREGFQGRPFRILKLRTMFWDAERRLDDLLASDEAARMEWNTHFKLQHDPRILPKIGRFLRKSSIDELPQLFNILAGDMRIVGPRPFPAYHLAAMTDGFREKRSTIKPGLTGLWQICERSGATIDRQQKLDEFYIENRSFWFDMHILLGTFWAVLRKDGAF